MQLVWEEEIGKLYQGDCLEVLKTLPSDSLDACVTDPPYGLGQVKDLEGLLTSWMNGGDGRQFTSGGFMSNDWDRICPPPALWREVYRVMKPGAYLLAFSSTRTWDLQSLAIRLAGFECRDTISHEYGPPALRWYHAQGFPKAGDISKQIDKLQHKEREVIGIGKSGMQRSVVNAALHPASFGGDYAITEPASDAAKQWQDWSTSLKPSWEVILIFRKPIAEQSLARQVLATGTGALNIGATRVGTRADAPQYRPASPGGKGYGKACYGTRDGQEALYVEGRWSPNLLLSHSTACTNDACSPGCPIALLDEQAGNRPSGGSPAAAGAVKHHKNTYQPGGTSTRLEAYNRAADDGNASRYFPLFRYQAKPSRAERNAGCEMLPAQAASPYGAGREGVGKTGHYQPRQNTHPTLKSIELMRWLVRLCCPPGGICLDPFAGSGSTLVACIQEGLSFIGIEMDESYCQIARARVAHARQEARQPAKPKRAAHQPTSSPDATPAPVHAQRAPIPLGLRRRKPVLPPDVEQLDLFA